MTSHYLRILGLFIAAAFVGVNINHASAMPRQPTFYQGNIVSIACERGNPNCLTTDRNAPTKCGGPDHPCVIDNGPDCQNASSCGTDNTGNHNLNGASNMPGVVGRQAPKGSGLKPPATVSGNKQMGGGGK